MGLNFFDWIREGVRQSILLGVTDAAEHLGSAADVESLNTQLLASIQQQRLVTSPVAAGGRAGAKKRKALGRSLNQLSEEASD